MVIRPLLVATACMAGLAIALPSRAQVTTPVNSTPSFSPGTSISSTATAAAIGGKVDGVNGQASAISIYSGVVSAAIDQSTVSGTGMIAWLNSIGVSLSGGNAVATAPLVAPQGIYDTSVGLLNGMTAANVASNPSGNSDGVLIHCAPGTTTLPVFTESLPGPTPPDGQNYIISTDCSGGITTFTAAPYGPGVTLFGGPSALMPTTPVRFRFFAVLNEWARW